MTTATAQARAQVQAQAVDHAAQIPALLDIMGGIIALVERETELVRAGKLSEAAKLESTKSELAGKYLSAVTALKSGKPAAGGLAPDRLALLRRRHEEFHALLQINLTVLATAHAVSEGIMRGVSQELARKAAPQTYGASGQHCAPSPHAAQPLAVSRVL